MKKQLTALLLCTATVLWTHNAPAWRSPNPEWEARKIMAFNVWYQSLGTMAKCSDVIAIGTVLPGTPWTTPDDYRYLKTYSIFRVDHPIWGCVSNQEIRVKILGFTPHPTP